MSMTIAQLEQDRITNHPNAVRVLAYLAPNRMDWIVSCPFCGLHHQHGAADGDPGSAGLRSPHCPPGALRTQDYYLIPDGSIAAATLDKFRKMDRRRLRTLNREIEQRRSTEAIQRRLRREQAFAEAASVVARERISGA